MQLDLARSYDRSLLQMLYSKLAGCTLFITGASRGIGKAIALRAARDGANVVIAAKTAVAHPKLPGTIYTAAEEGEIMTGVTLIGDVLLKLSKQNLLDHNFQ